MDKSITTIAIPDSVTFIADYEFWGYKNLKNVTLPSSLITIGNAAFFGCKSLTDIQIPNSVKNIRANVFTGCTSLSNIIIPDSVINIGSCAFNGCSNLTSINVEKLNQKFVSIDGIVFDRDMRTLVAYPCGRKTSTYSIPDSVTKIGQGAFNSCRNLTSITIPDSVTTILTNAFIGCSSITNITIPDSVIKIGSYAFIYCSSLSSVSVSYNTEIGKCAAPELDKIINRRPASSQTSDKRGSVLFKCEVCHKKFMVNTIHDSKLFICRYCKSHFSYTWKNGKLLFTTEKRNEPIPIAIKKQVEYFDLEFPIEFDKLKKKYKILAKQYHPDTVSHLGQEFKEKATENMKKINEYYEVLVNWIDKK